MSEKVFISLFHLYAYTRMSELLCYPTRTPLHPHSTKSSPILFRHSLSASRLPSPRTAPHTRARPLARTLAHRSARPTFPSSARAMRVARERVLAPRAPLRASRARARRLHRARPRALDRVDGASDPGKRPEHEREEFRSTDSTPRSARFAVDRDGASAFLDRGSAARRDGANDGASDDGDGAREGEREQTEQRFMADASDPFAAASDAATARLRARLTRSGAGATTRGDDGATTERRRSDADVVSRFDDLEIEASALEALEAQLEDAIESEDYASAASLKRAADALRASDDTGQMCEAYAKAIAEDRFEDAVRLRDAGVGLCGWWAGMEEVPQGEDDGERAEGDEAREHPTGVIMRISREHGRLVGSTYSSRDLADIVELNKAYPKGYDYDAGQPVMEIMLQEDADAAGGFRRDVMRLNYIPVSIPLVDDDEEEETTSSEALIEGGVGFIATQSESTSSTAVVDDATASADVEDALRGAAREDIESVKEEIKAKLLGLDPSSGKTRDDALEEIGAMLDKFNDAINAEDDDDDDDDDTLYDIKRTTAALHQEGLHAFVLTSDNEMLSLDDDDDDDGDDRRPFSHALDKEIEGFLATKWESMVPNADATASRGLGAGSHTALVNAVKEAAQEMFASQDENDEDLDEEYFGEGDDDDEDVDEVSAEELLALIGQDAVLHRPLPGRVRFQRIDPRLASGSRNDVFDGLYIGAFGPHGPEVLRMVRGRWGDDVGESNECVTAVKLTGDENVPCGAASFRAKVSKENLITEGSSYPDELGVLARYKGEGRVAKPGFADSHWVEGELLVLNGKGGSLTGGAELGFVWAVPGERRLLILFSSLVLPDVDVAKTR